MAIRRTLAEFSDDIATADLADDSVTQAKIGADAVGTTELANDVVINTSGAITTTGAFTSIGIDDNADATAITIDSSENVDILSGAFKFNAQSTSAFGHAPMIAITGTAPGIQFNNTGTGDPKWEVGTHTDQSFRITDDGGTKMTITSVGNVGIGTAAPSNQLTVQSDTGSAWIAARRTGSGLSGVILRDVGAEDQGTWAVYMDGSDQFIIADWTGVDAIRFKIDTAGDAWTNDGNVSNLASDIRVKKNITDIEEGLDIVNRLRPVSFEYNGKDEFHEDNGRIYKGFIADEVKEVASFYMSEEKGKIDGIEVDDLKTLSTTRMIPMMIKSIQELSAKVTALESA